MSYLQSKKRITAKRQPATILINAKFVILDETQKFHTIFLYFAETVWTCSTV